MSELYLWRGVAAFACLGWAVTVLADFASDQPAPHPTSVPPSVQLKRERPALRPQRRPEAPGRLAALRSAGTDAPDVEALRAEVRAEVEAELEDERRARHEAHRARRLERILDDVAAFAEEHGLEDGVQGDLEAAVLAMHDRMEELGPPPGPPGPGGPPAEVRDAMRESFDQLDADVRAVLDDDLAEAFHEWTRPGPPRPGGRPR